MSEDDDDISTTLKAKTDQLNADDLIGRESLTGRITRVIKKGSEQQSVWIYLDSWPQPYKPCLTMRRVIVDIWGKKGSEWVGKSIQLYRDPSVKYGNDAVGGIKVGAMSGLKKAHETYITITRGKKQKHIVKPHDSPAETKGRMVLVKERWKIVNEKLGHDVTPETYRAWIVEVTGLSPKDALVPEKFTPALLDKCERTLDEMDTDDKEQPRLNEVYHGLLQRINSRPTATQATEIQADIEGAIGAGDVTRDEGDELHELLRKEMA